MKGTQNYDAPKKQSLGVKCLLLALQCAFLMIGALTIWIMSWSREDTNREVETEIWNEWGEAPKIYAPSIGDDISPVQFNLVADVNSRPLHRGIYEAEVFSAHVNISGIFDRRDIQLEGDTAVVKLEVNTKDLSNIEPLKFGAYTVPWTVDEWELVAKFVPTELPKTINYSTAFDLRGSSEFNVVPKAKRATITIKGNASNPSFYYPLPDERTVGEKNFTATWYTDEDSTPVGTRLLLGVDRYQKVGRTLKYAFIIILLTYISVLLVELFKRRHIPLLNYFLVGAALILFYSLLLSFVEHISFGFSYLIASVMTIALISAYLWRMFGSIRVGALIGIILTVLYSCCYILLLLSTYALIFGSLLLFLALGAMMYASVHTK